MLYILDRNEEIVGLLQSNSDRNKNIYYDDILTEMLSNGADTFTFTSIADKDTNEKLIVGNYIAFKKNNKFKLLQIIEVNENKENILTKEVYCEGAGLELINTVYSGSKMPSVNVERFLKIILQDTNWQVGHVSSNLTKTLSLDVEEKEVYSIIQEYLYDFEAEIDFRVEIKGNRVVGRYIDVYSKKGRNNGKRLEINRDIKGISRKISLINYATKLIGEGKNGLNFRDISMEGEINKPLGQNFVINEDAYSRINNKGKHITRKFTYDTEDAYELLRQTHKALKEYSEPKITYEVDVDILDFNDIEIGDYVTISDLSFTPPLLVTARISELETSKTNKYSNKAVLSNFNEVRSGISSIFPILGDNIVSGSIGEEQMNPDYVDSIVSDSVNASLVKTEILLADKANIGDLNATNAEIENLKVNKAEITDLNATNANIENLKVNKAEITDLNATNANIDNLKANFAEIDELLAGNITAENIKANSITSNHIQANSIETKHLKANSIDADKIQANSIASNHIQANTINTEHLKTNSIDSNKIQANTITSGHIQANSITSNHIQTNSVTSNHIQANAITSGHIQADTITSNHIQTGTITAGSGIIADGAIGNAQISKIDAGKIEAGTIDTSKVTIQGANGHLRLKGNRMQVFQGTGNQAKERVSVGDVNGDGTVYGLRVRGADGRTVLLDENGVTSEGITNGAITNDKISDDANIDGTKLNINSVVNKINEDGTETIQGTKIEVDGTTLNTKLSTITTKQTEDSERISQAQSQITANTNAIKLKVDEQTYTTDKKDMTSKLEKNTSEISAMKGQIALKVEQTDIENAKSEMEGAIDTKIDSAKAEIKVTTDAISQNVSNLSQTVSTKADGSTVTSINNKVGSLETSVNGISGKVTNLEKTTTTLGGQVSNAQNTADSAINKANNAQSTANTANNTANTNKSNITNLQGEVSTVKSDIASLEVTTSGISQKVSSVESTTATLTTKVTNAQNTANQAKTDASNANSNATNALNKANSANTLADSKAKVFTSTPTTPYKVGDLWVQGNNGDVMRCKTARTSGSYTTSDWEKASKYTDDTKANAVDGKVTTLQGTVNTTNSKVATLETNLNGITQRVSATESTTATLTTKVDNAQSTANTAKSTADSAKSTATSAQNTANSANANATNALNTANSANSKVDNMQIGGRNLLLNSGNFKNTSHWSLNGGSNLRVETKDGFSCLSATGSVKHSVIKLEPSTSYMYWTEIMFNADMSVTNSVPLHYWVKSMPSGTSRGTVTVVSGSGTAKANKWHKIVLKVDTGTLVSGDTHIELTPFIYRGSMTESWWMKYIQVEKGTKATEWTPAPEDVQGQIDTHTTQISTTNSKVSSIETNLSGITSRVGTVESKQTTTDGKVTGLENRMSSAESKITESAITNTVKKNFYTKSETDNQITSKGYQTESQVQQTVNGLQVKVSQSGGYNLIRNSTGASSNTSGWTHTGTSMGTETNSAIESGHKMYMYLDNGTTTAERYAFSSRFKLKPNTTYRFTGYFHNYTKCPSFDVFVLSSTSLSDTDTSTAYTNVHHLINGQNTNGAWKKFTTTFTTPANTKSGILRIDNNGYNANGTNSNRIHWNCLTLTEGELETPWSPHPSEVYDGITTIDKDGVTVTASNVKSKTNMSANGFKITKTDTNEDVFKVNSDGTLYMKGQITVTGGSVPTSNLSGTISSNQLNSSITSDINNAKNNASSALSTANTAKSTADSAKSTATSAQSAANTASTNATNALNTANSVNNTVNSNKSNWNNAYNRVNEWAHGAVTGTTNINGGMIATNTITTNKLAIADFTNYCEMNVDNCSTYGFTKTTDSSASNNHWMKLNSLARDTAIVSKKNYDAYKGNVQGTYRISFEFNSTVKGATTSGGTDSILRPIGVGLYCKDATGASKWYIVSCSSFTSGTNTTYSGTVTLDSSIVSFGVYVQINGYTPFTGQLLIRNIKVNKMANGELIVDGAITADKIASGTITADKIKSGTITASMITSGTLDASKVNVANLNASNIKSGKLSADYIDATNLSVKGELLSGQINGIGGMKFADGAVIASYDSHVPGYKGISVSAPSVKLGDKVAIYSPTMYFDVVGKNNTSSATTTWTMSSTGALTCASASLSKTLGVSGQANIGSVVTNRIDVYGNSNLDGTVYVSSSCTIGGELNVKNRAIYGMNNIALARGTVYLPQGGGNNTVDYLRTGGGFMATSDWGNFHFLTRDGSVSNIFAGNVTSAYSLEPVTKISNRSVFDEINSIEVVDTTEGFRLMDTSARTLSTEKSTASAVYTTYNEKTEQEEVNIDYTTAISTLWKAIQELKQENDELKEIIKDIHSKL